ncbi:hypothetical protein AwDysgo_15420 [Bacteroidales bacterium]|nr:hypothetical protein AwDysgo_15420 [Bacteroidales bacterium]
MDNKLIEVANFTFLNDADILESILQNENIEYIVENKNSSSVLPGIDAVGLRLVVRLKDVPRAIKVITSAGFEKYLSDKIFE